MQKEINVNPITGSYHLAQKRWQVRKKKLRCQSGKGKESERKGERERVTLHSLSNTVLIIYFCRRRREAGGWEEGSELQLLGNVCVYMCVCVRVCVRLYACGEGGPGLLMYSHIMLGSDPAAVSKMFEAQNIIFEKCSHRLAILFLERPDIWPFSFSPSPTSTPSSLLLSRFLEELKAGTVAHLKENYHCAKCVGAFLPL